MRWFVSRALGQVFDLVVFDADLLTQKLVLAFEPRKILGRDRCDWSALVGPSGRGSSSCFSGAASVATGRDQVCTGR
jgi:hypothetical protein